MLPDASIVIVLTGHGWGKSAAAIGYAIRAHGRDQRPVVVQFVKGDGWNVAERRVATDLGIEWHAVGRGLTWARPGGDPREAGAAAWSMAAQALSSGTHGLVVLDEIGNACAESWVDVSNVVEGLVTRHPGTSVILTGRSMPPALCDAADIVTDMARAKDSHQRGILT